MWRCLWVFPAVAACSLLAGFAFAEAPPKKKTQKIDRTRVVGSPVLDDTAQDGVYVWLEDGWFRIAAIANRKARKEGKDYIVKDGDILNILSSA